MAENDFVETGQAEHSKETQSSRATSRAHLANSRRSQTSPRAKWLIIAAAIVLVAAGFLVWLHYRDWESTDDAEIDGYIHPISARVSGYVTHVYVDDNQFVKAGMVLVTLDPRDYQVAVDRAKAQLADAEAAARAAQVGVPITSVDTSSQVSGAQAEVEAAGAGITAAEKQYQAAEAKLTEAEANNSKAQSDLERYKQLVGKQEISEQQYDQAVAAAEANAASVAAARADTAAAEQQVTQARSRLASAEAGLRSAGTGPQKVRIQRARAAAAEAAVKEAQATLEQAELNLQYTTIVAPVDGIVGRRSAQAGQYVSAGQQLLATVPLENIWVTANFKETQLKKMRPGQPARIHVDAYGRDYKGHVLDIAGATGAQFSLLPPENATGNYVKVVQRVPVKIVFDQDQDPKHLLRVGMSVEPSVKVE